MKRILSAAIIRSKFGLSLDDWSSTRFHPSSLRSPWKGISSIFSLFLPHFHHTLGDGSTIRFWLDKWVANLSLSSLFPRIFNLTTNKIGPVAIFVSNSSWNLHLGRNLRVSKIEGLSSLLLLLNSQHPHPSKVDSSTWSVSPNGLFSISSFFSALASPPKPSFHHSTIWYPLFPPKVQGFLWKLVWHRPLTQEIFQRIHPNITLFPNICVPCFANLKFNGHLFLHCPFS